MLTSRIFSDLKPTGDPPEATDRAAMEDRPPTPAGLISADIPISSQVEDRYRRAEFADRVARTLRADDTPTPLVVGLYGPWGSGKSSVLNMIIEALERPVGPGGRQVTTVTFNPWHYRDVETLISIFFQTVREGYEPLQQDHGERGKQAAAALEALGVLVSLGRFSPVGSEYFRETGGLARRAANALRRKSEDGAPTVDGLRADVEAALRALDGRIAVVIDDIDRLEPAATAAVFQLIRIVASFPNVLYIVAFDREVVARNLTEALRIPGDEYLSKIVQLQFDVPAPDESVLREEVTDGLRVILGPRVPEETIQRRYAGFYRAGLRWAIRTPRDVRRYGNALAASREWLATGEVDGIDFAAIELARLFTPSAYDYVRANADLVLGPADLEESQSETQAVVMAAARELKRRANADLMRPLWQLLEHLFPALRMVGSPDRYQQAQLDQARMERRISSHEHFAKYFQLGVPVGRVSVAETEALLKLTEASEIAERFRAVHQDGRLGQLLRTLLDTMESGAPLESEALARAVFQFGDETSATMPSAEFWDLNLGLLSLADAALVGVGVPERRLELLLDVVRTCEAVGTLARYLALIEDEPAYGPAGTDPRRPALPPAAFDTLRETFVCRLAGEDPMTLADRAAPALAAILHRWKDWAGLAGPRAAVERLIASDQGARALAKGFVSVMTTTDSTGSRRQEYVQTSSLRDFTDVEALERRIGQMDLPDDCPIRPPWRDLSAYP